MRFLFNRKNNKTCRYCGSLIKRGELYILNSYQNKETGQYCSFSYHYECYKQYFIEKITRDALYYLGVIEVPKKLGRPRKYSNPKLVARKKALIYYHKQAGNEERALEVEKELDTLLGKEICHA